MDSPLWRDLEDKKGEEKMGDFDEDAVSEVKDDSPPPEKTGEPPPVPHDQVRRAIESERVKWKERVSSLENQLSKFQDVLLAKQDEPKVEVQDNLPNYDEDPIGHLAAKVQVLEAQLKQGHEELESGKRMTTEQARVNSAMNANRLTEAQFMAENPEYLEAVNYVREVEASKLDPLDLPDEKLGDILMKQEIGTVIALQQKGKSAPEYYWNLAKRYGFKPKSEENRKKAESKLEKIEKGMGGAGLGTGGAADSDDAANGFDVLNLARSERFRR